MKLQKRINNLEDVPEAFQELYVEQDDGSFALDYVDTDTKSKLDEFRNGNRKLNREVQDLRDKLDSYSALGDSLTPEDIEALRDARERQKTIEQDELLRELIDAGGNVNKDKLRSYADKQFEGERKDMAKQIQALQAEREDLTSKFTGAQNKYRDQIRNAAVRDAVTGIAHTKPGAMDDIIARAQRNLGFDEDDNLVILDSDGETRYGKKGGDPMTLTEWAGELVDSASHLFEGRVGGGAAGDGGPKDRRNGRMIDADNPEELGRNFKAILSGDAQTRTSL